MIAYGVIYKNRNWHQRPCPVGEGGRGDSTSDTGCTRPLNGRSTKCSLSGKGSLLVHRNLVCSTGLF